MLTYSYKLLAFLYIMDSLIQKFLLVLELDQHFCFSTQSLRMLFFESLMLKFDRLQAYKKVGGSCF